MCEDDKCEGVLFASPPPSWSKTTLAAFANIISLYTKSIQCCQLLKLHHWHGHSHSDVNRFLA